MTYFDFFSTIEYNKAVLESQGIKPKEILINCLHLTEIPDPMFPIIFLQTICGLKVIRTDDLEINDFRIIIPKQ